MTPNDLNKIIQDHYPNKEKLEDALRTAFGQDNPYIWGEDNEIDWGDGWWTSIWECVGDNSEKNKSYTYFEPDNHTPKSALIYDSPHSGTDYPKNFKSAAPHDILRLCEDTYIDSMIQDAVLKGAKVLKANFPRSYIDPNRAEDSLHAEDIRGALKKLSAKSDFNAVNGRGLIWMRAQKSAIYAKGEKPTEKDILGRIKTYYRPYHEKLAELITGTKEEFGVAYHINWHSCPRYGSPTHKDPNKKRADFILGDRNGKTFDPVLRDRIKDFLEQKGYSVAINKPYKGAEIVRRHSNPSQGIYSLQIEICRDLYMNEVTLEPHEGIRTIANVIAELTDDINAYIDLKNRPAPHAITSARKAVKAPKLA